MALDLGDLVGTVKRETNPPGKSVVAATDDEWLGRLMDAFWDGRLDGLFAGYVVDEDGSVTPLRAGDPDMSRDLAQAIVFLAAYNALYLQLLNTKTQFKAEVAGGTSYETQSSAQVLRELAQSLKERRDILLYRLSDLGLVPTYVIDGFLQRQDSYEVGMGYFVGGGSGRPENIGQTQSLPSGW